MFGLSLVTAVTRPTVNWKLLPTVIAIYSVKVFARVHSCILESLLGRLLLASKLTHHRI